MDAIKGRDEIDVANAPKVRAAALMFRDITGRSPIRMIWPEPPECPHCGDDLALASITADWFPYIHVDYRFKCPTCLKDYLHGQPMTKDSGLSLIIWDSNPKDAAAHLTELGPRKCPYGHGTMLKTKIFGDWFQERHGENKVTYQWKCPKCFLTHTETYPRPYPYHIENDPLTDKEKETIEKRLRDLGYFED